MSDETHMDDTHEESTVEEVVVESDDPKIIRDPPAAWMLFIVVLACVVFICGPLSYWLIGAIMKVLNVTPLASYEPMEATMLRFSVHPAAMLFHAVLASFVVVAIFLGSFTNPADDEEPEEEEEESG